MKSYPSIKFTMTSTERRHLLGQFIRAHRERLPAPTHSLGRRRTPGWRREELAQAAAVSVTWLTWVEQGRDVALSVNALSRLADSLKLTPAERASLFNLANKCDPIDSLEPEMKLTEEMSLLPEQFSGPAYLLDQYWTAQAWNKPAALLFHGWLDPDSYERNLLKYVFLNPKAKTLLADWPERAQRLVAEFRADFSQAPQDTLLQALINELSELSIAFNQAWQQQSVLHREGGERLFNHPQGLLRFSQMTLLIAVKPSYKLVCLTPKP